MPMRTSKEGLRLITQREGKILHVYKDSKGLPTAGVGHLLTPTEKKAMPVGTPITEAQCQNWLKNDLAGCEVVVNGIGEKLSQNEFDACVSLAFNIGEYGFARSTVARRLKAGNHKGAAEAILLWNKPPEIQGRRRGEYHQFLTPYPNSAAALASAQPPTSNTQEDSNLVEQPLEAPSGAAADSTTTTTTTVDTPPVTTVTTTSENATVPVTPAKPSIWTSITALGTAALGYYKLARESFGDLVDRAQDAIDIHFILNAAIGAGLVLLGIWLYDRARQRAVSVTNNLIATAADQNTNTVVLAPRVHWWSKFI